MSRNETPSSPGRSAADPGSPDDALTYRDAGVDIDAGSRLVERIKPIAARTARAGVMEGLGGFAALFELPTDRYRHPVLVAATDGVGTKLKLALQMDMHETVGIDLVAMCANDLVVQGAEPLFFLDYYATGRLDVDTAARVVEGIGRGCELAGAALVGGETAEMPGLYAVGDYDLAGFCVGVVERDTIVDGSRVQPGDVLIGLASSGLHSNGYSLVRKIIENRGIDLLENFDNRTLGATLLEPTRIYVKALLQVIDQVEVHSLAHITGGGLPENVPRVLPESVQATIDTGGWPRPPIFQWIQQTGSISDAQMYRTFNCGIGMVVCVAEQDGHAAVELLHELGEVAWPIGSIETASGGERVVLR